MLSDFDVCLRYIFNIIFLNKNRYCFSMRTQSRCQKCIFSNFLCKEEWKKLYSEVFGTKMGHAQFLKALHFSCCMPLYKGYENF